MCQACFRVCNFKLWVHMSDPEKVCVCVCVYVCMSKYQSGVAQQSWVT